MATVHINGRIITSRGNIVVSNGRVTIDGNDVTPDGKDIRIEVHGNVDQLDVDACQSIKIDGTVNSLVTVSGDVVCGNVGSVRTVSGDIG